MSRRTGKHMNINEVVECLHANVILNRSAVIINVTTRRSQNKSYCKICYPRIRTAPYSPSSPITVDTSLCAPGCRREIPKIQHQSTSVTKQTDSYLRVQKCIWMSHVIGCEIYIEISYVMIVDSRCTSLAPHCALKDIVRCSLGAASMRHTN